MTKKKFKEAGQISIFILVFLLIAGVFLLSSKVPSFKKQASVCEQLDLSQKISYNNTFYYQIRGLSALSTDQFLWHVKKLEDTTERTVYRAKTNREAADDARAAGDSHAGKYVDLAQTKPNQAASETFNIDPAFDVQDILFVDNHQITSPVYKYVNIYLRENRINSIPNFIADYCNKNQPIESITVFPNKDGNYYPPPIIKKQDIQLTKQASEVVDTPYTLFAYERTDSRFGGPTYHTRPDALIGTYTGLNGKKYDVRIVSFAQYLALTDQLDTTYVYLYSKNVPAQNPTLTGETKNTLQLAPLASFVVEPWGWWSPECKPAIYLYPKEKTDVSVQIFPKGYLTYTNPTYPSSGWNVTASPDGKISTNGKKFDYLYYESKIEDSAIQKPETGYVISFNDLPNVYSLLLPKLGLSDKETKDFKEYWEKVLPKSPYYFVGVMKENAIDRIEPLTISPKPDTIIRVRLYFEALDTFKKVQKPEFVSVKREGFTVVEWGGLVKTDKDHPFTCSQ